VLFSLAGSDFQAQDYLLNQSVYRVYNYLQFISHKAVCEKEYREIIKRNSGIG
jgi:hypothetical protein